MPASEVMPKFKAGKLHSGSPSGPVVTNPAQARAIAASEAQAAKDGKTEYQELPADHPLHKLRARPKAHNPH
jgi:hypothetical protein